MKNVKNEVGPSKNAVIKPPYGETTLGSSSLPSNETRFTFSENGCLFKSDNKLSK
jgi:hypothetical protein